MVKSTVSGAAGPSSARKQHHPATFNGLPNITITITMAGVSKAPVATAAAAQWIVREAPWQHQWAAKMAEERAAREHEEERRRQLAKKKAR